MARTNIVATQFAQATVEGMREFSKVIISHDPTNQYDDKALAVHFNNERIGYIGKNTDIYEYDRNRFPIEGKVIDFYIKDKYDEKFTKHLEGTLVSCNIEVEDQVKLNDSDDVKSFNEDVVINFNEESHTYTYEGKKLMGATTFIERYIQPFSPYALQNCIKYWKLERETIQGAWNLGRDLAALFGSGIHKALEFSDLYGSYKKPKDGTRCFNIKHPVLKNIVEEFYILNDELGFVGDVIPEALVSDAKNGHCALADRVLVTSWEDKRCRLQDYKVNIKFKEKGECKWNDAMPLNLPTTKLSKLAMQLKFQAQMLNKSGWTIEGCDGFVYAENGWEHHEVDMLEGFDIITGEVN